MSEVATVVERHRRHFGLKSQLLLLLFVLNLVAATAYSVVLYDISRGEIIEGIDGRLRTAAYAVAEIAPHCRAVAADVVAGVDGGG